MRTIITRSSRLSIYAIHLLSLLLLIATSTPAMHGQCQLNCPPDVATVCGETSPEFTGYATLAPCSGFGQYTDDIVYNGGCDLCGYTIVRTWSYQGLASCVQVLTVTDNDYPQFVNAPSDLTISCTDELPIMGECLATDGCDSELEYDSFTGGTGGTDSECELSTAFGPGPDWAFWIPFIGDSENWVFDGGGYFKAYADGTAHLWGTIINTANPNQGFEADIWLKNGMNWEEWSGLGRSYKDDLVLAGNLFQTWTYFEVANGFSVLKGIGEFEGSQLQVYHIPFNYYFGFQLGQAANNKNANYGLSGWFVYEGVLNGECVYGAADINTNADCNETPGCATSDVHFIWSATDDCGHTSYNSQIIDVVDEVAPVVADFESPIELPCDDMEGIFIEATDNCSSFAITYADEILEPGCFGTVLRIYTVTDACGNSTTAEQVIELYDDSGPFFEDFPNDMTVECQAVIDIPPAEVNFEGACSNPILTMEEEIIAGDCSGEYTILRIYTLTDDCGNAVTQTWTISVVDNTPPVLYNIPDDMELDCGNEVPDALTFALDNCDEQPVVGLNASTQQLECGYIFTRTWYAVDDCGNYAEQSQQIYVNDEVAPDFTFVPDNVSISCDYDKPLSIATAIDECSMLDMSYSDEYFTDDCAGGFVRTFTATDGCGNTATAQQTVNYIDDIAPVFTQFPQDVSVECDEIPAAESAGVEYTDNCSAVTIEVNENVLPGECINSFSHIYTYTITDACGNSTSQDWTITVSDNTPPVLFNVPDDVTVNCGDEISDAVAFATDNCAGEVMIGLSAQTVQLECGYLFVRTWTAEDECGNTTSASQTITVTDDVDPYFTFVPGIVNVDCENEIPLVMALAADECSQVTVSYSDEPVSGGCAGGLIRTFVATDGCGNTAVATQQIFFTDETQPFFTQFPPDVSVACDEIPAPESAGVEYSDNCSAVTLEVTEEIFEGDCAGSFILVRTYLLTDACGNSASQVWSISVNDNTAPVLANVPLDATINCGDEIPDAIVFATDNCTDEVAVGLSAQTIELGCGYLFIRTWTAEDECGNIATASQTITVTDDVNPYFLFVPSDIAVACNSDIPFEWAEAADECSSVSVSYSDVAIVAGCAGGVLRTFTATDGCGNTSSATQSITFVDNEAPLFTSWPVDVNADCDNVPTAESAGVEYSDNCSSVEVEYWETITPGDCPDSYVIERTWSLTDECGNNNTAVWTITVVDITPPQLFGVPDNITLECGEDVPDAIVFGLDNCSDEVVVTLSATTNTLSCGYEFIRTWSGTDACGNTTEVSQTVTFTDTTNPYFLTYPQNITVQCGDPVPGPTIPPAMDACDGPVETIVTSETYPGNCPNTYTTQYIYRAFDGCGNYAIWPQNISVIDTQGPVFDSYEADVYLPCTAYNGVLVSATDACGQTSVNYTDNVVVAGCNGTIIRTYVATDACGNSSIAVQTIHIYDDQAPVITAFPADVSVSCDNVPPLNDAGIQYYDLCSAVVVEVANDYAEGDCTNAYTLYRTWTLTDACGNTIVQTWTITVTDNEAPQLYGVPADMELECGDEIPDAIVFALDNCSAEVFVGTSAETEPTECSEIFTRTWFTTDECGNYTEATQVITFVDYTAPELSDNPADMLLFCEDDIPEVPLISATDNCDDDVEVIFTEVDNGGCDDILRTWCATDCAGNEACWTQTISFFENINNPDDQSQAFKGDGAAGDLLSGEVVAGYVTLFNAQGMAVMKFDSATTIVRVRQWINDNADGIASGIYYLRSGNWNKARVQKIVVMK